MNGLLACLSLVASGWSFGILTAFWWDDRAERKLEAEQRRRFEDALGRGPVWALPETHAVCGQPAPECTESHDLAPVDSMGCTGGVGARPATMEDPPITSDMPAPDRVIPETRVP